MSRWPLNLVGWDGFTTAEALEEKLRTEGGWGRPDYLASLYAYAKRMRHPGLIVEIGTQGGESSVVIGQAIRHTGSHLISIDPAHRPGGAPFRDDNPPFERLGQEDWYLLQQLIRDQQLEGYITQVPDYSANVLARWDGRPVEFLFVDGAHTYKDVALDCGWLDLVSVGGLAAFDDWTPTVRQAAFDSIAARTDWAWALLFESVGPFTTDHRGVTLFQRTG